MKASTKRALTKKNRTYLRIAVGIVLSGIVLSATYRPYIYANDINDFRIADTLGSLIAVIGFCFFVWGFKEFSNSTKNMQIVGATLVYSLVWEPLGLLGIHGTFDWYDMIAAGLSGIMTFIVKAFIESKYRGYGHKQEIDPH